MKKLFFLAVAAVVALAACTKNEADTTAYEQSKVINFSTFTGKATKAPFAVNDNYFPSDAGNFGVYAAYLPEGSTWDSNSASSKLYMGTSAGAGKEIKFNSTLYIWEPKDETYYWPLQGNLTFFAYYPYTLANASYTEGTTSFSIGSFTVNTTVSNQVDVLVSDFSKDKTANSNQYADEGGNSDETLGVPIVFKHMLAQVVFTAAAASDVYDNGLSFKINDITVGARKTSASMTVTPGSAPVWAEPSALQAFDILSEDFPNATVTPVAAANWLDKTQSDEIGDALLMIPNDDFNGVDNTDNNKAAEGNDDEYFTVTYTLYRMNDGLAMGSKTVKLWFNDNLASPVTKWEAGKKYTYKLTIGLEKIYFAPEVASWTPATDQPVLFPVMA